MYKYMCALKQLPLRVIHAVAYCFLLFLFVLFWIHIPIAHLLTASCLYGIWHAILFHITTKTLYKVIQHDVYDFLSYGHRSALLATDFLYLSHVKKLIHYGVGVVSISFMYILSVYHSFIQANSELSDVFLYSSILFLTALIMFYFFVSYVTAKHITRTIDSLQQKIADDYIPNVYIDEFSSLVHTFNAYNDRTKQIFLLLHTIGRENDEYRYIAEHSHRVANYCLRIGEYLGLNDHQLHSLYQAALLHDIGKIGIPIYILLKKEPLSKDEFSFIQQYPNISYFIAKMMLKSDNEDLLNAIRFHKEHVDGTGYPNRLKQDEIPLLAKIISAVDAFDAMTSSRPYRKSKSKMEAMENLLKESGTKWDDKVVNVINLLLTKNNKYVNIAIRS
ncbi:HD domain-containing phosphohydrolase [Anoxybacillus sp. D401a]|uniref:HD domain-containing phosphohydrolase n=2 Tax=Anoxybacillus sp. D401a TaxID=575112 RepID=UPI003D35DB3D